MCVYVCMCLCEKRSSSHLDDFRSILIFIDPGLIDRSCQVSGLFVDTKFCTIRLNRMTRVANYL